MCITYDDDKHHYNQTTPSEERSHDENQTLKNHRHVKDNVDGPGLISRSADERASISENLILKRNFQKNSINHI